jgi:fibronectin-binding autotransporter adhesin
VTVSGSTLLSFTHGTGNLVVSNGGAFAANGGIQFGQDPTSIVVNGGTLTTPGMSVNGTMPTVQISDPVGGAALTFAIGSNATTYSGPISDGPGGPGSVVKSGSATLTLTGALTNTGGYTSTAGQIEFNGAVVDPGSGSLTAALGATMQYDNNTRVFGGFLYGPGTHLVSSAAFTGATSTPSATINVGGAGASFTSFSNGGNLSIAANLSQATLLKGFTNEGSGSITVGAVSTVNVSGFQTYGLLTLNPAVVGGGQFTELVNTGTSSLFFNGGSRTFIGTAATAINPSTGQPADVAGINLNGQNAVVASGLFVNNGFVADGSASGTATIIADFGAVVKGAGYFQNPVITQNGGKFQAGNSPGSAAFGNFVFGPGGVNNYVFAIDDATGTAGPSPDALGHVSGWGLVKAIQLSVGSMTSGGNFAWTATPTAPLTVAIDTLINPTTVGTDVAGPMADFDPTRAYSWVAAQWTGTYSGPTAVATLDAATSFDTSGFVNPIRGTFGWALDSADQTLSLTYTPSPVPEPSSLLLAGFATAGIAFRRRNPRPGNSG